MNSNVRRIFLVLSFRSLLSIDKPKGNDKPIYELLSLDGVPTYFILNFSGKIIRISPNK